MCRSNGSRTHHQRKNGLGRPLDAKAIDESAAPWRTFRGAADVFCYHPRHKRDCKKDLLTLSMFPRSSLMMSVVQSMPRRS